MAWTAAFTDAFTRGGGSAYDSLPTHDATWTNHYNNNRLATTSGYMGSASASRSTISTTLTDNQAAEIKLVVTGNTSEVVYRGPMIRVTNTGSDYWNWTGYWAAWDTSAEVLYLFRGNDGTGTQLDTETSVAHESGDTLRLEASGSNLRVLVNGVEKIAYTDATYGSGKAGIMAGSGCDDWGDDFVAYNEEADAPTDILAVFLGEPTIGGSTLG